MIGYKILISVFMCIAVKNCIVEMLLTFSIVLH